MKQISARAAVGRGIQGDLEDQPLASNVAPPHWLREAQRVHAVNQANQVTQSNCSKLSGISWMCWPGSVVSVQWQPGRRQSAVVSLLNGSSQSSLVKHTATVCFLYAPLFLIV